MNKKYISDQVFFRFDELIDYLNGLALTGKYVFRGFSKQDQLLPGIIRDSDYSTREKELLTYFEKYGSSYYSANSPIDFMSYAQHFGLPTRLIDFTRNPYIALSFALAFLPQNSWQQYWGDELVFKTVADLPMERELYLSARNTWCRNDEEFKCLGVLQDYFDEVLWG